MTVEAWRHHNPVAIRFGRGCRSEVVEHFDQRCLVVTSARGRRQLESDPLLADVVTRARPLWRDAVQANPDRRVLQQCIDELAGTEVARVVAFGGGSAIDSAKALALALSPAGRGRTLEALIGEASAIPLDARLPLHALPTTAGTGSEVTPYATIWDHAERRKLSLAGPAVYPCSAFIDPELTDSLPPEVTLATGLDAINQAGESIWNRGMTPVSEALAHRALVAGFEALPRLMEEPGDRAARDAMAETSLLAGLAISQTRTSLCHAISYPLTAHFGVPHGLACAFTMPAVLRHNLAVDDGRFRRLAALLAPGGADDTEGLLQRFNGLNHRLGVADRVRAAIGGREALFALRGEMFTPGRSDNGIAMLDGNVLQRILEKAWSNGDVL